MWDYLKVYGPIIATVVAGFVVAWQFVDPAPPRVVRMASGAPEGSIEEAIGLARTCVDKQPSVQNSLLLTRALLALDEDGIDSEAMSVLEATLSRADTYPRDRELRSKAAKLLGSIKEE